MPSSSQTSSPRKRNWLPGEQLAVTVVLLIVFAIAWRWGDPRGREARTASLDAATRTTTESAAARSVTAPGYGRHEVATRPFDDLREVTNSIGMTLREVPRTLGMVGNADDPDGDAPPRFVKTDPFFIATTEVTRGQWKRILGAFSDPSIYINEAIANDSLPVNNVDYPDAIRFCKLLSAREGRTYRLPTEFEWEIACWGRRNNSIFAARAVMKIAAMVGQGRFKLMTRAQEAAIIELTASRAMDEATQDLIRLGYRETASDEDLAAFQAARVAIAHVRDRVIELRISLSDPAAKSKIYDAILPEILPELNYASYSGGPNAAAARFEDNSTEAWTRYGKYQAAWWRGRESRPVQAHPLGLQDMLGSMMEWTATPTMPYPYDVMLSEKSSDDINRIVFEEANIPMSRWATLDELSRFSFNPTLRDKTFYVVRGGSFERAAESCTPWNRYGQLPLRTRFTAHRESLGFRVVLEP